ncbi:MAG: hypothetical protein LBO75_04845 [Bifidobacteriaceae bacterium]|jgi:hypothetical protein|nr:hypothetical protein [Bifidobacteriaceae bacterium]
MTINFGDFFRPGAEHLREEEERKRQDIHQRVVEGPPFDAVLDQGSITVHLPAVEKPKNVPTKQPGDAPVG